MSDKPGKFTQQFDAEIFNKKLEELEDDTKKREQNEKLSQIQERLNKRKKFLLERFTNAQEESRELGIAVKFSKDEKHPHPAHLEFLNELNEDTGAIFVKYTLEMEGEAAKQDYITISLKKFDLKKVENFIESKILQFARSYVQGS